MTRGTLQKPVTGTTAAGATALGTAPDTGIISGSRAELKELSDNALLAKVRAPRNVNPVDWTAERAWLLLRMGEADAARMLVVRGDAANPVAPEEVVEKFLSLASGALGGRREERDRIG